MEEETLALQKELSEYGIVYEMADGISEKIEDVFHAVDEKLYARKKNGSDFSS